MGKHEDHDMQLSLLQEGAEGEPPPSGDKGQARRGSAAGQDDAGQKGVGSAAPQGVGQIRKLKDKGEGDGGQLLPDESGSL